MDAIALDRDEKMFVERMEGSPPQPRQRRLEISGACSFAVYVKSTLHIKTDRHQRRNKVDIYIPTCRKTYTHTEIYIYIYIFDPGSAGPPPPPPSPPRPPMVPPPRCGVWWWLASPLPVVWCGPGVGLLVVVLTLPPCGIVWVRVSCGGYPLRLWVCFGVWYDDNDDDGDDDHHLLH